MLVAAGVTPYYDDGRGIVIFHADARDVLPTLDRFDLLLTDPPYGIGADRDATSRSGRQRGNEMAPRTVHHRTAWDDAPADDDLIRLALDAADRHIIWGGNFFTLPPSPSWLVWDKDNGNNRYADAELAWTDLGGAVRMIRHRWHGMFQEFSGADKERRVHPTQKPLRLMRWCVERAWPVSSIVDPFMGSGTTLRAAKDRGVRCVGVELDERHCEEAAKRLAQESLF